MDRKLKICTGSKIPKKSFSQLREGGTNSPSLTNQVVHDPDSWTDPHLLHLKSEYDVLVNNHGCIIQEMYTVQAAQAPPSECLLS
jgi:hypothetical protein